MTVEELAALVRRMRDSQGRDEAQSSMVAHRERLDWERKVDQTLEAILNPPRPGLFDGP